MTAAAWLTLCVLAATLALLIFTKLPPAAVFLGALTAAMTLGLAPQRELLSGFSNPGVITVAVLYIVASGAYSTGATSLITNRLIGRPKDILQAQARLVAPVALCSAFLNNTPLVAMMIPVVREISRTTRLAASKLYIPLSYASILGGASTVIGTSTNLVVAGMVLSEISSPRGGGRAILAIAIFDPAWVAIPAALVGIAFILLFGRRLLPESRSAESSAESDRKYRVEFAVDESSPLRGKTLEEVGWDGASGHEVVALCRRAGEHVDAGAGTLLAAGDVVTFAADIDALSSLWTSIGVEPFNAGVAVPRRRYGNALFEVVVSPWSQTIGTRYADLVARDYPGKVAIVAVSRHGGPVDVPISKAVVEASDNVVLEMDPDAKELRQKQSELSLSKRVRGYSIYRTDKAVLAVMITLAMVAAAATGMLSMLNAALLAAGAMLLTRCVTLGEAARSVELRTLVVLACAIGMEPAVTASGLSARLAEIIQATGGGSPHAALAVIFVSCVLMANLVTNAAAAAFAFPIALSLSGGLGVSFTPFAIAIMLGSSYAFISPVSYQTNLMVYSAGAYRFGDFARIGVPFTVVVSTAAIVLTPLVFGFHQSDAPNPALSPPSAVSSPEVPSAPGPEHPVPAENSLGPTSSYEHHTGILSEVWQCPRA